MVRKKERSKEPSPALRSATKETAQSKEGRMNVLALDMSSVTGWAIGSGPNTLLSGTWDITPRRGESPGMRFVRFRAKLEEMRRAYPDIKLVVYEQAHHRGGAPTQVGVGLVAILLEWCAFYGVEHTAVHSSTLKKYATGNGKASKEDVVAAANARGWAPQDDNEADALFLLDYGFREILGG